MLDRLMERYPAVFDFLALLILFAGAGFFGWMIAAWLSGGIK